MKRSLFTITQKILLTITIAMIVTVIFSYAMSHYFYEKLYVEKVEETLLFEGKLLSSDYTGGPLTDKFRENIEWYNSKSFSEVFVVNSPKELSVCLPFEIDYTTLISPLEREQLLRGEPIRKTGYEERFDRDILAVITPLLDGSRLEGIIYIYIPLAPISELTNHLTISWLIAGLLFLIISIYIGTLLVRRFTKPIMKLKEAANRVSKGDYSARVLTYSGDEIGQLALAFNQMSSHLQQEDEKKNEFLANVSHELRTPLSYVTGYSEALMRDIVIDEKKQKKYLELIYRESNRMARLVEDLMDLAKLNADEYRLTKTPLVFAQLIEDATEKYVLEVEDKGLKLEFDLDPDIIINGDEGRIEQILQNVIDNALRYTSTGGITITLKNHVKGCVLSIKDSGIGIDDDDILNITERFYRVNKARTRADGGTGLGLAITKKLIDLHNGELKITSELGKGTTVSIIFATIEAEK